MLANKVIRGPQTSTSGADTRLASKRKRLEIVKLNIEKQTVKEALSERIEFRS